jgi:flagellar basal-body rod modification protein FlgD
MSTMMTNPLAVAPSTGATLNPPTNAAAAAGAGTTGGAPTSADSLSTAFLQLLIAQLQNQDPENPVDGTTFVTQLAQFTSVQQETQSTSDLGSILSLMQNAAGSAGTGSGANDPAANGSASNGGVIPGAGSATPQPASGAAPPPAS